MPKITYESVDNKGSEWKSNCTIEYAFEGNSDEQSILFVHEWRGHCVWWRGSRFRHSHQSYGEITVDRGSRLYRLGIASWRNLWLRTCINLYQIPGGGLLSVIDSFRQLYQDQIQSVSN